MRKRQSLRRKFQSFCAMFLISALMLSLIVPGWVNATGSEQEPVASSPIFADAQAEQLPPEGGAGQGIPPTGGAEQNNPPADEGKTGDVPADKAEGGTAPAEGTGTGNAPSAGADNESPLADGADNGTPLTEGTEQDVSPTDAPEMQPLSASDLSDTPVIEKISGNGYYPNMVSWLKKELAGGVHFDTAEKITLTATAQIKAGCNMSYQWQKSTVADTGFEDIPEACSAVYEFKPTLMASGAADVVTWYRCVVKNSADSSKSATSESFKVRIQPDPSPVATMEVVDERGNFAQIDEQKGLFFIRETSGSNEALPQKPENIKYYWKYTYSSRNPKATPYDHILGDIYDTKEGKRYNDYWQYPQDLKPGTEDTYYIPFYLLERVGKFWAAGYISYRFQDAELEILKTMEYGNGFFSSYTSNRVGPFIVRADKAPPAPGFKGTDADGKPIVNSATCEINKTPNKELQAEATAAGYLTAGTYTFSYQWEKSTDGRNTWTDIPGATEKTYKPTDTLASKGKIEYRCGAKVHITEPFGNFTSEEGYSPVATIIFRDPNDKWDIDSRGNYLIKTADDLIRLRDDVNSGTDTYKGKTVKLDANTNLTLPSDWEPIGIFNADGVQGGMGKGMRPFSGTFDGVGKSCSITVPKGGKPLFGALREATVKNLYVYGEQIDGAGFVAEKGYGIDYGPDGQSGGDDQPAYTVKFSACYLKEGSSTRLSGFIHGMSSGMNSVYFYECKVLGTQEKPTIIGYGKDQSYIGAFCGQLAGVITGAGVSSYVTVQGKDAVGGMVGAKNQSMGLCRIIDSTFSGTVEATGNYVGGIIGKGYTASDAPNTPCVSVNNCLVSGTVKGAERVGGIFGGEGGCKECWSNGIGYIQNNLFTGTVDAPTAQYKGSIIGFMKSLNRYNVISNNFYKEGCGAEKGIGFVEIVDTSAENKTESTGTTYIKSSRYSRTDDPLGNAAEALAKSATLEEINATSNNTVQTTLKAGKNAIPTWSIRGSAPRDLYLSPSLRGASKAFMEISGSYRKVQYQGEELKPAGMKLILNPFSMSQGVTTVDVVKEDGTLTDGVTLSGYDMNTLGRQTVEVNYKNGTQTLQDFFEIEVWEKADPNAPKINVSFTLLGDDVHGDPTEDTGTHTLVNNSLQTWMETKTYALPRNTTVWELMQVAAEGTGITYSNPGNSSRPGNYVQSITRKDTTTNKDTTLGEFTNGTLSGWMYTRNGIHPDLGISEQRLEDGDVIVLHYTDDYPKEYEADKKILADQEAVQKVKDMISGLPATVTLEHRAAIEAARAAYDALTYTQKYLLGKEIYNILLKAEAALAKFLATPEDREKAAAVEALIRAIKRPVTAESRAAIEAARAAYDALTKIQKDLLNDIYQELLAAEEEYGKLPEAFRAIHQAVGDYLLTLGTPTVGSTGGEWMVIGLARAGRLADDRGIALASGYYENLEKFVKENINKLGQSLNKNEVFKKIRFLVWSFSAR